MVTLRSMDWTGPADAIEELRAQLDERWTIYLRR